jgi:preprotein translocase SecE subunit
LTSDELKSNSRYRMKRWFFGVGKEFSRVSWVSGRQVWKDFVIIIIIVAVLALLFLGIDAILTAAGVIG